MHVLSEEYPIPIQPPLVPMTYTDNVTTSISLQHNKGISSNKGSP